jgi:hypothetical protein
MLRERQRALNEEAERLADSAIPCCDMQAPYAH